jgi:glutathione peroxidase|tara:strand:+ start:636 stop:1121 length:486 start_codon:yes stop_codon:yes gene_type:complete
MSINAQTNIYDISIKSIDDKLIDLNQYKGKNVIFVNVASRCGYTGQYAELQELQETYDDLEIIGIPCNQFLFQEPKSQSEIKQFCSANFGVTFMMTEKINVKGKNQHDLYKWLTNKELNGSEDSYVKWNFQKYLVNKKGEFVKYFPPRMSPLSEDITKYLN